MNTARAFTLVEMTIVIGIIILLAGLTLAVSVSVVQGSEVRQTELTIRLLDAAVQEWQAQSDRQVTYGLNDEPPPLDPVLSPVYEIREQVDLDDESESVRVTADLIVIISRSAGIKEMLAQINSEFVRESDTTADPGFPVTQRLDILDAWGKPIIAVFPGREWEQTFDAGIPRSEDGTIQTAVEGVCGTATNRQVCFVSAGPDGDFGDLAQLPDTDEFKASQDNLYSYTPTRPQ